MWGGGWANLHSSSARPHLLRAYSRQTSSVSQFGSFAGRGSCPLTPPPALPPGLNISVTFKNTIHTCSLLQHSVTSICDSTSISWIQRPLKACFHLLHDDDDDDDVYTSASTLHKRMTGHKRMTFTSTENILDFRIWNHRQYLGAITDWKASYRLIQIRLPGCVSARNK